MSSIIGRSDMTAVVDKPYNEVVAYGIAGISEMYAGFADTRKGWLKTVAVCLTLYSRQGEPAIREGLKAQQSEAFRDSLRKKPDRRFKVEHVIAALNASAVSNGGTAIDGSAKTRLKQAVSYICKLGDTLDERINELDEFESFNALIKKVREDEAGRVSKPEPETTVKDNILNGERRFTKCFYEKTSPAKAIFEMEEVNGRPPIDGLWVALCRASGSKFEIVRMSRQSNVIDPMITEAMEQDVLLHDEQAAEAAKSEDAEADELKGSLDEAPESEVA
ncbi:hypothetical protein A0U92_10490 [Acetobacter aceti]|uniref:Uncharacterized protein n=2 Tax=Acetobacter aceti TaxID=435 RepID=A0A1U9KHA2_ACEAC|nr:hypothetical protein A0U92_10490 [Acetobacter aceti]